MVCHENIGIGDGAWGAGRRTDLHRLSVGNVYVVIVLVIDAVEGEFCRACLACLKVWERDSESCGEQAEEGNWDCWEMHF